MALVSVAKDRTTTNLGAWTNICPIGKKKKILAIKFEANEEFGE